ncbi:MAG: hypothetical protein Q8O03_07795 [Nanoarchaeota archaeon]|nr:hypothetical protein [Nanoarchaeota archaeon]
MGKALIYLVSMLLICSSAFAITISDIKPDDRVEDLRITANYTLYREEDSSILLDQPFFSYKDVDAYVFVYNSSVVDTPKGHDLVVIFEEWKSETDAKNRFERDFKPDENFQECRTTSSRSVKKCEKLDYPQLAYVLYYKNFLIRIQPYPDYPFTTKELFYLSSDMQKLNENIISKISKLENPVEKEVTIAKKETIHGESVSPAEDKQVSEEPKQGFFSRNKYYILGSIGLLLMIFWVYKTKNFFGSIFIIILGLIIFNGYTVFTRNEVISWALLWTITYFFFEWFYVNNIKKHKRIRKEDRALPEKNQ